MTHLNFQLKIKKEIIKLKKNYISFGKMTNKVTNTMEDQSAKCDDTDAWPASNRYCEIILFLFIKKKKKELRNIFFFEFNINH